MKHITEYTSDALDDLRRLSPKTSRRIIDKISYYSETANPLSYAKSLEGKLSGSYRFRIGVFRVLFYIDKDNELIILKVYKILNRKDVYE